MCKDFVTNEKILRKNHEARMDGNIEEPSVSEDPRVTNDNSGPDSMNLIKHGKDKTDKDADLSDDGAVDQSGVCLEGDESNGGFENDNESEFEKETVTPPESDHEAVPIQVHSCNQTGCTKSFSTESKLKVHERKVHEGIY